MGLPEDIAELEAILAAGARTVQTDGTRVEYDLAEVRRRLAQLRRQQDHRCRPRSSSIDLSGF